MFVTIMREVQANNTHMHTHIWWAVVPQSVGSPSVSLVCQSVGPVWWLDPWFCWLEEGLMREVSHPKGTVVGLLQYGLLKGQLRRNGL